MEFPEKVVPIARISVDLLAGGVDTSVTIMEWAMTKLLKQPPLIKKATKELDRVIGRERWVEEKDIPQLPYIEAIVKETMRKHPVAGFLVPRLALEDCDQQVIVRRWDQLQERLVKVLEEEEERYCQAVKSLEFDRQLGPYNLSQYGDWKHLSNYITKSIIEWIEPIGGEITVACESGIVTNTPKTAMEKALDEQMKSSKFLTSLDYSQSRRCYYTSIPHVIKQKGIHGQELISLNIDKTQLLESLLIKDYGGSEDVLLGELQFAFIAFLMGQSLEGFLQWKALVNLLFGCIEAPFRTRTQLFTKFIKVIYYQLKFGLEKDRTDTSGAATGLSALLDDSWLSTDSFLHHLCEAPL
nr:protein AAR2 homolog [Quercus suber]